MWWQGCCVVAVWLAVVAGGVLFLKGMLCCDKAISEIMLCSCMSALLFCIHPHAIIHACILLLPMSCPYYILHVSVLHDSLWLTY